MPVSASDVYFALIREVSIKHHVAGQYDAVGGDNVRPALAAVNLAVEQLFEQFTVGKRTGAPRSPAAAQN